MADIIKLIQVQPDLHVMTGASDEAIKQAEQTLGLRFAADYRKYVSVFGAVSFSNHEFTGICNSKRLSVVDVTIRESNNTTVPDDWYVLEQTNIDGIILWQASNGSVYQTTPNTKAIKICCSLSEYIAM